MRCVHTAQRSTVWKGKRDLFQKQHGTGRVLIDCRHDVVMGVSKVENWNELWVEGLEYLTDCQLVCYFELQA